MNTTIAAANKPFKGFLTQLLNEAFYREELLLPAYVTASEEITPYEYEDSCDQQQFLRNFLGKAV